jgi:hypothetical protein
MEPPSPLGRGAACADAMSMASRLPRLSMLLVALVTALLALMAVDVTRSSCWPPAR